MNQSVYDPGELIGLVVAHGPAAVGIIFLLWAEFIVAPKREVASEEIRQNFVNSYKRSYTMCFIMLSVYCVAWMTVFAVNNYHSLRNHTVISGRIQNIPASASVYSYGASVYLSQVQTSGSVRFVDWMVTARSHDALPSNVSLIVETERVLRRLDPSNSANEI